MKTVFHWSSGKDSALALYQLQQDSSFRVDHLVTTINEHYNRVTMHGTPMTLLKKQVRAIGINHSFIELPESATMEVYEERMRKAMEDRKLDGYTHAAFGDIFLEDLKAYREKEMNTFGFETIFPLWKHDTTSLIHEFVDLGFKAVVVACNDLLGEDFLGKTIDESFLEALPEGIDPCGENGEFHTFCFDGPIFKKPVPFELGEKIQRSYPNPTGEGEVHFWFQDLLE